MKKIISAIFFPHIAIVAVITVFASLSLIYSLVRLPLLHHISIFSYCLTAYAATIIVCAIPELIDRPRQLSGKLKEKRRRGDCRRVIRDSRRQAADDAPPVVSFCRGSGDECCHCCHCCQFQYQFPIENWQHWYWQQFHIGNIYKTRVSCLASHVPRLYFGARR